MVTDATDTGQNHLPPPEFYTAHSGAELAGVSPHTVRARIQADAIYVGQQGKKYELYRRATLETFRASRDGGTS